MPNDSLIIVCYKILLTYLLTYLLTCIHFILLKTIQSLGEKLGDLDGKVHRTLVTARENIKNTK